MYHRISYPVSTVSSILAVSGLLTNVGMVISNPAYSSNTSLIDVLNRAAYHGTVIWCVMKLTTHHAHTNISGAFRSFQQALMASGIARQLGFCSPSDRDNEVDTNPAPSPPPSWCADSEFVQELRDAQSRLWNSIRGARESVRTGALY